MRVHNLRAAVIVSSLLVVLVACASPASPNWTYAPASAPPAASPSVPAGSPPAASPSALAGSPSGSGAPSGDVVRIAAKNIAFDQAELTAPANVPFQIVFDNQEPVPHNVAIYSDASAGQSLFVGEIFAGPGERTYAVPALPAGSYFYRCDVHPVQMTGTLVAR